MYERKLVPLSKTRTPQYGTFAPQIILLPAFEASKLGSEYARERRVERRNKIIDSFKVEVK